MLLIKQLMLRNLLKNLNASVNINISGGEWKECCQHVINIEDKYWSRDCIIDTE